MERLHMESPDLIEGNIEKISLLFPEIITEVKDKEGGYRKAIDFDKLKALLTHELATLPVANSCVNKAFNLSKSIAFL